MKSDDAIQLTVGSAEFLRELTARAPKCFLCRWILHDVGTNGKLTGWPPDSMGHGTFPVEGKVKHLELEGLAVLD